FDYQIVSGCCKKSAENRKKNISIEILEKDELIIDTVERYQGDERKLIIFSTTVANGRQVQNMQNIAENDSDKTDRKLLVSISRASEQIIVLGNSDALRSVDAYDKLLSQIINSNGYLGIEFSKKTLSKIRLG
ncbi:MAG: AAA domain-containing protein, partial [Paludibacteraceae bacterium]